MAFSVWNRTTAGLAAGLLISLLVNHTVFADASATISPTSVIVGETRPYICVITNIPDFPPKIIISIEITIPAGWTVDEENWSSSRDGFVDVSNIGHQIWDDISDNPMFNSGDSETITFYATAPMNPGYYSWYFKVHYSDDTSDWCSGVTSVIVSVPTPTATATTTSTPTFTATPTITPTSTISPTFTPTPSVTPTRTTTPWCTFTSTLTGTPASTSTTTPLPTATMTGASPGTPTMTATRTAAATRTNTPVRFEVDVVAYPQPANQGKVNFWFAVEAPSQVSFEIYNMSGECVCRWTENHPEVGYGQSAWDCRGVAPGIYLYRLKFRTALGERTTPLKKIAVLKYRH